MDDQDKKNGLDLIFRNYDRIKELKQKINRFTLHYYLIGILAISALALPAANNSIRISLDLLSVALFVSLWGVSPILEPLKKKLPRKRQSLIPGAITMLGLLERNEHIPKELKREQSGLAAEIRIAQTLKDNFKKQKVKVFAQLDNNCLIANPERNKDLDILASFPNGQRFAISVKKRDAKTVYIDAKDNIRLVRKGSTVKMSRPDPARELIEQEKWLRKNRKNLLSAPGSSVVLPSVRVLIFAPPTLVGDQKPHQYGTIGNKKYVRIERGKDFVYLLQEDQLCDFIAAILKLK